MAVCDPQHSRHGGRSPRLAEVAEARPHGTPRPVITGLRSSSTAALGAGCKTAALATTISGVPPPPRAPAVRADHRAQHEQHRRLYDEAAAAFGPAIARLAASYERDPHRRQDLLQEIHLALWRSLAAFDGRCALRTWVYRVAHNVAASHVLRDRRHGRHGRALVSLEALENAPHAGDEAPAARLAEQLDAERQRARLAALVAQLAAPDRQLVLLYLEGLDAAAIGEVTGLSPGNVATKVHRIKRVLARRVLAEDAPAERTFAEPAVAADAGVQTRPDAAATLTPPTPR